MAGSGAAEPIWTDLHPTRDSLHLPATRVCDGILEAVGETPLVRLRRYVPRARFQLFAKIEALNPAGSIKDRPAARILEHALRSGGVRQGTVVIESSSGNMGIGLAQACRYYGLRFEFLQARLKRVQELLGRIENSFWPNQYANERNSEAHHVTMREVEAALGGRVDFLFAPTSTCGTLRGCSEYIRRHALGTRVIAVDAYGSLIFSDLRAERLIPGLGAGVRPPLCDASLVDECVHVTDLDCVIGCRRLMEREAIFAGGSSGGVLSAVEAYRDRILADASVVAILPDRGERYLGTLFSDDWVREHFGDVQSLWASAEHRLER
jgi:cysteine synthase